MTPKTQAVYARICLVSGGLLLVLCGILIGGLGTALASPVYGDIVSGVGIVVVQLGVS